MGRTAWHLRVGWLVPAWLLATIITSLIGLFTDLPVWLVVHLLLLGAVSNAILIWSQHFSAAMQRLPEGSTRRDQAVRLLGFNLGAVVVIIGMQAPSWPAVVAGALVVAAAVIWHAASLWRGMRRALPSRFGLTVSYYVAAGALLPFGIAIGVAMAPDDVSDSTHARLALAHVAINVLGWIGLTVVGTIVTLMPTMLHTQVAEGTVTATRRALPVLITGIAVIVAGALLDLRWLAVAGVVAYLVGLAIVGWPISQALQWRTQYRYAPASVLASITWFVACIISLGLIIAGSTSWETAAELADRLGAPLLVGFAAQLIIGALSFLIPVVLGGGPAMARATNAELDRWRWPRLAVINVGVVIALAPLPTFARIVAGIAVLACFLIFLVLALRAVIITRRR